jgi:3-isopropylmalate/(R)-2-methylmalate dehydratase small subunit
MDAMGTNAIEGRALPLHGDDIDTDRIIPARYLRSITFDGLETFVFEDDRKEASAAAKAGEAGKAGGMGRVHPFDDPRFQGASVLLVQKNFGCGSSREHAPQAIQRWGVNAIVGESFSEIFFGNSSVIGLPCVTANRADLEALMTQVEANPALTVTVDLDGQRCVFDGGAFAITMPPAAREAFLTRTWDTTGMLLDRFDDVRAKAAQLPYVTGF